MRSRGTVLVPSTFNQRLALSSTFLVLGFELGVWAVSLPSAKDRMGLTYSQVGLTLLVLGISSLASMSSSPRLMVRYGERRVLLFGGLAFGLSALGPACARDWPELLLAAVVLGASNGLFDASQNALSVHLERAVGRPIIISFHAWFSAGGLLAALLASATLRAGIDIRALLVATAVAAVGSVVVVGSWLPRPVDVAGAPSAPLHRPRLRHRGLLTLGVLAFAMFTTEGAAYDWANLELRSVIGAPPQTAALAFGAFSLGMLGLRLSADRVVAKVGPVRYFKVAALVAAVGFAVAIASTSAPMAIAGWSLAGIGIAGCVPLLFAAAGRLDPHHSSTYVARAAAFGYCGFLAGPSIIGFAAQLTGLRLALLIPLGLCLVSAALGGALHPRRSPIISSPPPPPPPLGQVAARCKDGAKADANVLSAEDRLSISPSEVATDCSAAENALQ